MNDYIKDYLRNHQDWIKNKEYTRLYDNMYVGDRKDLSETLLEANINFLPHLKDFIPAECFANNKQLTYIAIPPNISSIQRRAFNSSDIQYIQLPPLKHLGPGCFGYCMKLKSISIQGNINIIPNFCFYNCTSLETITLSSTIEEIQNNAFDGCINLKHIDLPPNIMIIGKNAFAHSGLESIKLPFTIMTIYEYAFNDCKNLKEVIVDGNEEDLEDMCGNVYKVFDNPDKIKFTFLR